MQVLVKEYQDQCSIHRMVAIYRAVINDGKQMFCTYEFDGTTFLKFVRKLQRYFGKILILCQGITAQDKSTAIREEQ